jgi:hypothetical protein
MCRNIDRTYTNDCAAESEEYNNNKCGKDIATKLIGAVELKTLPIYILRTRHFLIFNQQRGFTIQFKFLCQAIKTTATTRAHSVVRTRIKEVVIIEKL